MISQGRIARTDAHHLPDTFVWHPSITDDAYFDFIRLNYYTSITGALEKVEELKNYICSVQFDYQSDIGSETKCQGNLVPHVFHKSKKNLKARNVDLQISIDLLRAAHLPSVDAIYLFSGDGDYVPLLQEAARHGKEIWVAAFSSGMNSKLKQVADTFVPLDNFFFQGVPAGVAHLHAQAVAQGA
jgi:uncharacterized LabA/DUF88 family protein